VAISKEEPQPKGGVALAIGGIMALYGFATIVHDGWGDVSGMALIGGILLAIIGVLARKDVRSRFTLSC
jgi:hypothetical protein